MRKRIYEIINIANDDDKASRIYDIILIISIIASIIPLCFSEQSYIFFIIDRVTVVIFMIDYLLRLITADYLLNKKGVLSFITYPARPMAVIDLLAILPTVTRVHHAFKVFRIFRLFKTMRIFKFIRYSKNINTILRVLSKKKDALMTVVLLALSYIFVTALIAFQVEPDTFDTFFQAFYWAAISLTTVGYGDIYPVSDVGRMISMVSSFLGIAVIALPSGIIIAGFQEEIEK